ncbi:DUF4198 domain-containing protein [Sphingomonas sp. G-3-2-10]|uniref:DUF4198 domain-containing protein n=1 Tax=Sphingomonas sp. G-3-2-10 TaxID=2728838 RepID=UPI00146E9C9F|nr:DUF4198 domain-containing protein [Sphingomonas sp. G-3-2-10]NML08336.1 DUF4198 domain-containing protein [Sphingomonas sp. G-3-2-10]
MFNMRNSLIAVAAVATLAVPAALAHRQWMLPSSTIVSGEDNWISVDAAVSNDLFFFDHRPLAAMPKVTQPDGTEGTVENHKVGQLRATFDVHLTQQGTYRIAIVNEGVFGSYELNGETKQLPRGTNAANLAQAIPAGATNVRTSENIGRNEIYVTQGAPSDTIFKPAGKGIELVPVTHPNDVVAGEAATFQFLLDGKPGANLTVTIINGGIRYRHDLNQIDLKTDAQGKVTFTLPDAGMYWVNVTQPGGRGEGMGGPGAGAPGAAPAAGAAPRPAPSGPPPRRANYMTTIEVQTN